MMNMKPRRLSFQMMSEKFLMDKNVWKEKLLEFENKRNRKTRLVAIIGPQSSGKSTFLNFVFNTNFEEMNAAERLGRTTGGMWISDTFDTPTSEQLLIVDVEGVDGLERGPTDFGVLFETRGTLYTLMMADVVILNLKETDIGRDSGACVPLLVRVFEALLQQTAKDLEHTVRLMVLVRDFNQSLSGEALTKNVCDMFENVWEKVPKPRGTENIPLGDLFDLFTVPLINLKPPPSELDSKALNDAVSTMRQMFFDPQYEGYMFEPDRKGKIFCDMVEVAEVGFSVWEKIHNNQKLDLGSHRELVARARCSEKLRDVVATLRIGVQVLEESLNWEGDNKKEATDPKNRMEQLLKEAFETCEAQPALQLNSEAYFDMVDKLKHAWITERERLEKVRRFNAEKAQKRVQVEQQEKSAMELRALREKAEREQAEMKHRFEQEARAMADKQKQEQAELNRLEVAERLKMQQLKEEIEKFKVMNPMMTSSVTSPQEKAMFILKQARGDQLILLNNAIRSGTCIRCQTDLLKRSGLQKCLNPYCEVTYTYDPRSNRWDIIPYRWLTSQEIQRDADGALLPYENQQLVEVGGLCGPGNKRSGPLCVLCLNRLYQDYHPDEKLQKRTCTKCPQSYELMLSKGGQPRKWRFV